jgi:DNA invertase Pin-like site-specific DNA recombinase
MANGQRIGYVRVSTVEQNASRQLEGHTLDRVFEDKVSGKNIDRPQLKAMLEFVREGDTILVHSMDRLARNLDDLRHLVKDLTSKGVKIQFLKENLTFTGDDSPMANLLLSVMGAVAEFERALIRERQMEGIALAKKKGKFKGRKPKLSDQDIKDLRSKAKAGEKKAELAREYGISRETLYKHLRDPSHEATLDDRIEESIEISLEKNKDLMSRLS